MSSTVATISSLDPLDVQNLRREGTIIPATTPGTCRIHKRRLNRSSDEEYSDLPLPSPSATDATTGDITSSLDNFEQVPATLISRETLSFVGFNDATADRVWANWNSAGSYRATEGGMITFEEIMEGRIHASDIDACEDNDDEWRQVMDSIGIKHSLQDAIMTPSCKKIRLTASCKYWLLDTVSEAFIGLQEIYEYSRQRSMAAQRAASHPGSSGASSRPGSSGEGLGGSSSSQHALLPGQVPSFDRSVSQTLHQMPGVSSLDMSSPAASANTPGNTVLYRGGYTSAVIQIYDQQGNPTPDLMHRLQSNPPGDFNSKTFAAYFAIDYEIAQAYAFFAKKRLEGRPVSVLRVEISNAAIEGLRSPDILRIYWPSQEWKRLVHTCRSMQILKADLVKYKRATLVIGTICGKPNKVIRALASPDKITEDHLFKKTDGGIAVQYVFEEDQGAEFLGENARRCVFFPLIRRNAQELEEKFVNLKASGPEGRIQTWASALEAR